MLKSRLCIISQYLWPIEYLVHLFCVCNITDNIIDAVVMCICMIICQQVNPPLNKMPLLKQLSILSVSIHWGKYCGHCFKKKKGCGGKLPAPLEKIRKFVQTKGKLWIHQQLVPCSLQNCTIRANCCYSNRGIFQKSRIF